MNVQLVSKNVLILSLALLVGDVLATASQPAVYQQQQGEISKKSWLKRHWKKLAVGAVVIGAAGVGASVLYRTIKTQDFAPGSSADPGVEYKEAFPTGVPKGSGFGHESLHDESTISEGRGYRRIVAMEGVDRVASGPSFFGLSSCRGRESCGSKLVLVIDIPVDAWPAFVHEKFWQLVQLTFERTENSGSYSMLDDEWRDRLRTAMGGNHNQQGDGYYVWAHHIEDNKLLVGFYAGDHDYIQHMQTHSAEELDKIKGELRRIYPEWEQALVEQWIRNLP